MPTPLEKAQAIVAAYDPAQAREWSIPGTDLTVQLQQPPALVDGAVVLWLNVTRSGVRVPVSNPFVFVNPPLRRGADAVDRPLLAFLQMVRDAVVEAAWRR
jgi:hypothetical protein